MSVVNGIEALFDDVDTDLAADSAISKKGVQAIIAHYAMLSEKKYGFDISAQGSLKNLAASMASSAPKAALSIYHKIVELYPDSAYAISSLARAYADIGDVKKALDYQTKAVEKSKSMIAWHQKKHQQYLDELKVKMKLKTTDE